MSHGSVMSVSIAKRYVWELGDQMEFDAVIEQVEDWWKDTTSKLIVYVSALDIYHLIAFGAIFVGVILVIIGFTI